MQIITFDRESGSEGRGLGKRLSDVMRLPYYDDKITKMVAEEHGLDENRPLTLTIGRRLSFSYQVMEQSYLLFQTDMGRCQELCHLT